jgi:hypothetical protein
MKGTSINFYIANLIIPKRAYHKPPGHKYKTQLKIALQLIATLNGYLIQKNSKKSWTFSFENY